MTSTEPDLPEIPDSLHSTLGYAGMLLLTNKLQNLSDQDQDFIRGFLAALLFALHDRADQMADSHPVPGKIAEGALRDAIPGYGDARLLADYIIASFT